MLLLVCHTSAGIRSWYPTHWGTSLKTSKTRALPLNSLVGKRLMTLSKTSPINLALVDNKNVDLEPISEEEYSSHWYPTHWGTSLKTSKTKALPLNSLVGKRLMTLSKTSPINLALVDNKNVDLEPISEEEYSSHWYPTHWGTSLKTSKTKALPLNSLVGKRLMTLSKTSPINLAPVDNKDVDLKPVSEEEYSSNWL